MLVGSMVEYYIQDQEDIAFPEFLGNPADIFHVAEPVVNLPEITDRIAAVTFAGGTHQYRHDMYHINAQFLEIRCFVGQVVQIFSKAVSIKRHANPFLRQEPVMILLTQDINALQLRRACNIAFGHRFHQAQHLWLKILPVPVECKKQRINRVKISAQPSIKMS
jgi:hypothetical protein